jgi:hypothetical protein
LLNGLRVVGSSLFEKDPNPTKEPNTVRYTLTIHFTASRDLTASEKDALVGATLAQVAEPVDANGDDLDLDVHVESATIDLG